MGNMGYCRFENTLKDLEDCYEEMDKNDMSESEAHCRERLIELCTDIANNFSPNKLKKKIPDIIELKDKGWRFI